MSVQVGSDFDRAVSELVSDIAEKQETFSQEELNEMLSQELYYWCAELEKTEEVNPTKKATPAKK